MSELDTMLTSLRDDLHATITPPDLAEIGDRARHRTVRRRMQIGAVAAVVAVSVAVPLLRSVPDEQPPARPPATKPLSFDIDFADEDHGYALGRDCEMMDDPCHLTLLATTDGGRSWEERELRDAGASFGAGGMTVLGPDRLVIDFFPEREQPLVRLYSPDSGRTWRDVGFNGIAAPALVPDGEETQQLCVGTAPDGSCAIGVGTSDPETGRGVPTPAQPPLVEAQVGGAPTEGGRYWAIGRHRENGQWAVSVSADRGASWATTTLPDVPGTPARADAWSVVEAEGVMYATMQGAISTGPYGLMAVFRSTDKGLTWANTWRATPDTVLQAMLGVPVATTDGRLLVYSAATGTYESRDGGRTFARAGNDLPGEVTWTRAGYLAKGQDHVYALSTDGIEWQWFTVG